MSLSYVLRALSAFVFIFGGLALAGQVLYR